MQSLKRCVNLVILRSISESKFSSHMTFLEINSAPQIMHFMPKAKVRFQQGGGATYLFHKLFHNFSAKSHDKIDEVIDKNHAGWFNFLCNFSGEKARKG